jgi:C4-dicarboxylate-specific signal transduction histidine kinase
LPPEERKFDAAEALDKAAAQVKRAGHIITRLRDFIAHGEPNKLVIHLHDLINSACHALAADATENGVNVTLKLEASDDSILADPLQMHQVLNNLIKNAEEAMATSANRELVISTGSSATHIRVDISDTGAGLADQMKHTLFEPFTTTKAEGMGVGLSISQAIIVAHDGEISIAPNPEGGAIFSIILPLASTLASLADDDGHLS